MSTVVVIPARYGSTRLSGKALLELGGKSIIERVYEQASKAQNINKVIIATDDSRIYDHALSFGAEVYMTSTEHQSGTDRIAELAAKNPDWSVIVNVQGDEPFINPDDIDRAVEPFIHDPLVKMVSLYHEASDPEIFVNPNNVKVVTDINGNALYFSRAAIPYKRDVDGTSAAGSSYKKHIGLYVYRREILLLLAQLPKSTLEETEKLEQLRALENGISIKMIKVNSNSIGIDTAADYQKALEIMGK